jgi:hypothetical protein
MPSEWEKQRKAIAEEMVNTPSVNISLTAGDVLGLVTLCQCASRGAKAPVIVLEMAYVAALKIQNFLAPRSLLLERLETQWLKEDEVNIDAES